MNRFLGRMGLTGAVIMCVIVLFVGGAQAERKKISGTDKVGPPISETSVLPGDVANHRLLLTVRRDTTKSADPEFNDTELMEYQQIDDSATGGVHKVYFRRFFKNGDTLYGQSEGASKVSAKGDGTNEITWEGKWQVTGGTGKFKSIKGSGTYRGKVTKEGAFTDWEGEVEY